LILIFAMALLIFGPRKLPELGQGLGKGIRGFKDALRGIGEETAERSERPKP
jgi:sec-independent protein translocase protein TatA